MKIRLGFVSNSSSSSFVVYGQIFNDIKTKDILSMFSDDLINGIKQEELENIKRYNKDAKTEDIDESELFYNLKEELDSRNIEILHDTDDGLKEDQLLIGARHSYGIEENGTTIMSIEELQLIIEKASLKTPIKFDKCVIVSGNKSC